jgi:hypothetical protein
MRCEADISEFAAEVAGRFGRRQRQCGLPRVLQRWSRRLGGCLGKSPGTQRRRTTTVSVDTRGVQAMALIVDMGERGDVQDHAVWLNARLVEDL